MHARSTIDLEWLRERVQRNRFLLLLLAPILLFASTPFVGLVMQPATARVLRFGVFVLVIAAAGNAFTHDAADAMRFDDRSSAVALYFSFVTITTLGYGDIVPVSEAARMLASFEAFTGQVYITILVARLVGLHIAAEQT